MKANSAFARFGSWSSGVVCNLFHGSACSDFNCAFKLVNGALLRSLCLEAKGLNYSTEILSKILERRVHLAEVEIEHRPRARGRAASSLSGARPSSLYFCAYVGVRQLLFRFQVAPKGGRMRQTDLRQELPQAHQKRVCIGPYLRLCAERRRLSVRSQALRSEVEGPKQARSKEAQSKSVCFAAGAAVLRWSAIFSAAQTWS